MNLEELDDSDDLESDNSDNSNLDIDEFSESELDTDVYIKSNDIKPKKIFNDIKPKKLNVDSDEYDRLHFLENAIL